MRLKLPNFDTKRELFDYLVANKAELVSMKKSVIKHTDGIDADIIEKNDLVSKLQGSADSTRDTDNTIYRTIIGNTYYWLDSHEDVHLPKCFKDSITQKRPEQIFHYHDHINQVSAKVGKFYEVFEDKIAWKDLNINKEGDTEALFSNSAIKKAMNPSVFMQYKDGDIEQHSVGMYYVKIGMAINDPDFAEEYKEWRSVYPLLGNPEKADKLGYFYTVKEAKLIEISCVPEGSNKLTPTLEPLTLDPLKDSQETIKIDPSEETVKETFNYNYFI